MTQSKSPGLQLRKGDSVPGRILLRLMGQLFALSSIHDKREAADAYRTLAY